MLNATSATDGAIQKKIYGSGMTTFILSNKEIKDIVEIVKYVEESGLLNKSVSKNMENELKEQKGGLLGMLATTLGVILFGDTLADKGTIQAGEGQDFKCHLML